jgi:hypothetical protein
MGAYNHGGAGGGVPAIPADEVVTGSGTGIQSSPNFMQFDTPGGASLSQIAQANISDITLIAPAGPTIMSMIANDINPTVVFFASANVDNGPVAIPGVSLASIRMTINATTYRIPLI